MATCRCLTRDDTVDCGARLGARLGPGDVLLLSGDLGAGKTTFTQGVALGYGIDAEVTSPSFALIHEYATPDRRLVHFDPYRLPCAGSADDTGWEAYLEAPVLVVIEWPERLGAATPSPNVRVRIERLEDDTRALTLSTDPADRITDFADVWR